MGANVACLMWMRTTVNYQYRNGGTFLSSLRHLYADGGIPRFYRGVLPALVQGPLSRFGDTAANTGVLTMLNHLEGTKDLNVGIKTACASAAAATWRIFLMPVDTVKVGSLLCHLCFESCFEMVHLLPALCRKMTWSGWSLDCRMLKLHELETDG